MTYTLRFLPAVEDDVLAGYSWYESKTVGLGEEFLRTFYASTDEIRRNPLHYAVAHREFRRCLLRRFPYAVYFRIEASTVIVFALYHCARDPRTIRAKLKARDK